MARVKGGNVAKNRRRKVLKEAKGYFGSKHRLFRTAKEQVMHSGRYAYRDRKNNKRNFRKLWITRINAACRLNDISYSRFISGLNKAGVTINRKMLATVAIDNPELFTSYVNISKDALAGKNVSTSAKKVNEYVKKSEPEDSDVDLNKLKLSELKELAKANEIDNYASMKKDELIKALSK